MRDRDFVAQAEALMRRMKATLKSNSVRLAEPDLRAFKAFGVQTKNPSKTYQVAFGST